MTSPLQQELDTGISTLSLDIPAPARKKLVDYIDLLHTWNRSYNLTAIRDPQAMVALHVLDSLSVLPFLGAGNVLDVGAGAGLPGIPLALANPEQKITLLDTNGKKTRFLTQAKITLGLDNVEVVNARVQEHQSKAGYAIVISRAYASTDDFIETTQHLHTIDTRILVMQGKLDENIARTGYGIIKTQQLHVPGLDADRHLLEICRI